MRWTPADRRDIGMREALVHAVGDRPVVVERGKDVLDAIEDGVDADDVQEGLLLPGKGGVGQIFGGRAGTDRNRDIT